MPAQAGIQGRRAQDSCENSRERFGVLVRAKTLDPRVRGDDTVARTSVPLSLTAACLGTIGLAIEATMAE